MSKKDDGDGKPAGADPRVAWINDRLMKAVGALVKADKAAKLLSDPENM
jgi:hypothetical protein